MKLLYCPIADLKIIQLDIHTDARGFFVERYRQDKMLELGINGNFVQDNHSCSAPNVLRGMHYQKNPAQEKLVGVTRGKVWNVAVDIRPDSPTFGKYHAIELSVDNGLLFWIPAGFANGFCVLGDEPADILYKVSGHYNAVGEGGISYNDAELAIKWPVKNPLISERDKALTSFAEYRKNLPNW